MASPKAIIRVVIWLEDVTVSGETMECFLFREKTGLSATISRILSPEILADSFAYCNARVRRRTG